MTWLRPQPGCRTFSLSQRLTAILLSSIVIVTVLLSACSSKHTPSQRHDKQLFAFGTLVDITILHNDPERASQAIDQISHEFDRLHALWHPWKDGALSQLNLQLGKNEPGSTDPSIVALIEQSQLLSSQSDGLFNPAIGQLIKLWQFDQLDNEHHRFQLPSKKAIENILQTRPAMADLKLSRKKSDSAMIQSANPHITLDFGAFAKGVAIELMMEQLKQLNIDNALINSGGDLKVLGNKGDQPWRIGIKNPDYSLQKSNQAILAAINLNDHESLFTSGNYERFFEFEGQLYHHIIDPRSGYPARGTRSVTVLANDAGLADAASTALFIAGAQHWPDIARKMGIQYVMLISEDDKVYLSEAMSRRIKLLTDVQPVIVKL